jgi:excisionase family DNA binding protein
MSDSPEDNSPERDEAEQPTSQTPQEPPLPDKDMELAEELREDWMRITYASRLLNVDPSTLYKDVYKGKIIGWQVSPGLMLIRRQDVLNWKPGKSGRPRKDPK